MPEPSVVTKLFIPPVRENAVSRLRLINQLNSIIEQPGSFALVSCPAGFGKTTLLIEFVTGVHQPVAWLSLDELDNNPIRFWTYLVEALKSAFDGVGESVMEVLEESQAYAKGEIPALLINELSRYPGAITFILDDFHEIQNQSICEDVQFLIEHIPQNFHLIISTRVDPPWPLARYRALNKLIEIRVDDLRFNHEEVQKFLIQTMGIDISSPDTHALEMRTEGWAAGLQLAALSIRGRTDVSTFVQSFSGSNLYVADYLIEEVLESQTDDIRTFLVQTSILRSMCGGLVEEVTGFQDGQHVLKTLHHDNIFVTQLDPDGLWFRYHRLFSDLLQVHLSKSETPETIAHLHNKASNWYEVNGFDNEAVTHSLTARDYTRAADLVKKYAYPMINSGQITPLVEWLKAIPKSISNSDPHLLFFNIGLIFCKTKVIYPMMQLRKWKSL